MYTFLAVARWAEKTQAPASERKIYGPDLVLIAELSSEEIHISFGLNDTQVVLYEENTTSQEWWSCSEEDMLLLSILAPKTRLSILASLPLGGSRTF